MTDADEKALGARIKEARERADLKQGQLGELAGLERTTINKIESGARRVTALELADIASALGVRMSSLLSEPVPALVSHRASQGLDTTDSRIDHLLAGIASDVEFIESLAAAELDLPEAPSEPMKRPDTLADADELAVQARAMLGLDDAAPMHDLVGKVAAIGLLAFSRDLGPDTADAGTILLRRGAVSLVNSQNKVGRRRLALAHELGHFLVADEYTVDWRVTDMPKAADTESRLDRFARALLLPEPGVTKAWSTYGERGAREAAVLTASDYRVDMATLTRRLDELGLIDRSAASQIRGTVTTRTDIVEFGLVVPVDLEGTSLPLPYQKAVLRAFRDEQISTERAIELMHNTFTEDDLPSHRVRRENEIWNFVS